MTGIQMQDDNTRKRSSYSRLKKIEVVKAYLNNPDDTMKQVCDKHGIKHASIVHRWVKDYHAGKLHGTKRRTQRNIKGTKPYNAYADRKNGTAPYNTKGKKDTTLYADNTSRGFDASKAKTTTIPITPFNLPNGTQLVSRVNGKEPGFGDNHVHITLEMIVLPVVGDCIAVNRGMANEIAELFETPNLINTLTGRSK